MPAPATTDEFLDLVRKSELVPADRLNALLAAASAPPASPEAAANLLVKEGLLSNFQSKQILMGRWKRFMIGGKYKLLELLGVGGMGAVYLCEHVFMHRLVALKVLPAEKMQDPSALKRFYREARAAAALDHPNIVRAYDIDQYDKLHFLVMEYVEGSSLQEVVARHRPISPVRAAHYIAQAATGLQHAHELGMVHRDIKPGNLLLDRSGTVKVLDMGLARFFNNQNDSITEKYDEKCVLGTADYLAPEQAVTNTVDIRADIYSLGGTLYFLLTGETPFPEGTIAQKLVYHQTKEPKPVTDFRSDVTDAFLAVLHKMTRKEPEDRYQTPNEVVEALSPWTATPIPPPADNDMPRLCPAVRAAARTDRQPLMPHTANRIAPSGAASRSAANRPVPPPTGPIGPRTGPMSPGNGSASPKRQPVVVGAAAGTGTGGPRTASTRPLPRSVPQVVKEEPAAAAKTAEKPALEPRTFVSLTPLQLGLLIGIPSGLLALALLITVLSGLLGGEPGSNRLTKEDPPPAVSANDPAIPAGEAVNYVGTLQTVQMRVAAIGGTTHLHLNSQKNFRDPNVFTASIQPAALAKLGKSNPQDWAYYQDRTIHVRGVITRRQEQYGGGPEIVVRDPSQLMVVE